MTYPSTGKRVFPVIKKKCRGVSLEIRRSLGGVCNTRQTPVTAG